MWNGLPIVIFGTSGNAREIACIIDDINKRNYIKQYNLIGYVSENDREIGTYIGEYKVVTSDVFFEKFSASYFQLGVVFGMSSHSLKRKICNNLSHVKNIIFPNIISPFSVISKIESIKIGNGNIIAAGCTLTCDIKMGDFNFINRNCTIGHDCVVGNYCTINPTACISGNVTIEDDVLIGASSSIMQSVTIGHGSNIGLGAFVIENVEKETTVICEPAKNKYWK